MSQIHVESKADFQAGLERRLNRIDRDPALKQFADQYFSQVPLSEVVQKSWEYAQGTIVSAWSFFKQFDGGKPAVRVFNPTQQRDGYEHTHTVIEVACPNYPFLLGSIRIALTNADIVLIDVQQCLMNVVRSGNRIRLVSTDEAPGETLIHLEVSAVPDIEHLARTIRDVIRIVRRATDDFDAMRQQLLLCCDEMGAAAMRRDTANLSESHDCLQWLYDNNFTFIGYDAFVRANGVKGDEENNGEWTLQSGSALGLSRRGFDCHGLALDVSSELVAFSKAPLKSRVHRNAYLDCVSVRFRSRGTERLFRFIGLFTATVYNQSPDDIPIVRVKMREIFESTGLSPTSHKGRELGRLIELLPREELFLASTSELKALASNVFSLQERRIVRVMVRRDANGHFINCLVYMPRDVYNTRLRVRIQNLLCRRFDATDAEFSTFFSESVLVRSHFLLRVDPGSTSNVDIDDIEQRVAAMTRSWEDDLHSVILRELGEEKGEEIFQAVRQVFPAGYREDYWPATAFGDIEFLLSLSDDKLLDVCLYQWIVKGRPEVRFKLYHRGDPLPLSDIIPILENLGAKSIEEHPYELNLNGDVVWIHDFVLEMTVMPREGLAELKDDFEEAFKQIWHGGKENDGFNLLVPSAGMSHREVALIRAYSRYLGQLQAGFSQAFIASCLSRYSSITAKLFELFERRFDPKISDDRGLESLRTDILLLIDEVENLAEDRILRRFVEMILATQRTNFFQVDSAGASKEYISLKLLPKRISEMPLPIPEYEIFVYSPRVEGVHLRGGKIARGGIRWSDRGEDYRTEILGLVKAQQVKNSVIVPVGAKGGFLPKSLPESEGRDAVMAEGVRCYRIFIQGLLDLTDNLVKGRVLHPRNTVRYDEDDYYLVVAADKGTATFSDIANEIALRNGFWLGDAFASGGSHGYDHKQMGITARGAWISVQQHFRDLGIDDQSQDFTVLGIGDMGGDVFGNGMLRSPHICLVAAFNHQHIFIDPNPEARAAFAERQRLFEMPRSSWADYNVSLISRGGGIFSRAAKSIPISREMKQRFGITESALTPTRLINELLKSEVDLLWNGGIGTYVKSHRESHLDVGDKSNDVLRANANELRCKVVVEGGNLGMTQLARVEFCLNGGRCFTDSIDNAGGVNCSDAEVNIKILLNQLIEQGRTTIRKRNRLLEAMTDEVAEIVLDNNYHQAQAINLMEYQAGRRNYEYARIMHVLEERGGLDAALEFLPSDEELQERRANSQSFTSPEIAVITSYTKAMLKQELAASELLDEPYLVKEIRRAFPPTMLKRYGDDLADHRLRREIIATQIANGMINRMGINFVTRMSESVGVDHDQIARAYIAARDIFEIEELWDEIQAEDYKIDPVVQKEMMITLIRLVRRTARWLLRNRRHSFSLEEEVPQFHKTMRSLFRRWDSVLCGDALVEWQERKKALIEAGASESLSGFVAGAHHIYATMGIVEATNRTGATGLRVASVYFAIGERLGLHWFSREIHEYQAGTHWEALARETLQDDLNWQQVAITLGVIVEGAKRQHVDTMIDNWIERHGTLVNRWMSLQSEMRAAPTREPAVFTVAIRELLDLAQASSRVQTRF